MNKLRSWFNRSQMVSRKGAKTQRERGIGDWEKKARGWRLEADKTAAVSYSSQRFPRSISAS